MRPTALVLLVTLELAGMACATNRKPLPASSPTSSASDRESYAVDLARQVTNLQRQLDEEAKARLSERADSSAVLTKSRTEMAARLDALSKELRRREAELKGSLEAARHDAAQCSGRLEQERARGAEQQKAAAARLAEVESKLEAAEAQVNTSAAEISRQRDAATLQNQQVKELDGRLADSEQRNGSLEKELAAVKEGPQAGEQASAPDALEKARAEIDRLNALNIEQQALLDERYGVDERDASDPTRRIPRSHDLGPSERARTAAPIAKRFDQGSRQPSSAESPNALTLALARRDEIQAALTRLQDSPSNGTAPAHAAELQEDLNSVNAEIRRLTVLLNLEAPGTEGRGSVP